LRLTGASAGVHLTGASATAARQIASRTCVVLHAVAN
jgi:hypothetical protein